jgi:thioredoxin-dependent peroxiredoxin
MKTIGIGVLFVVAISISMLFAGGASMLVKVGQKAPEFALQSSNGDTVRLADFAGRNDVVLIFYPGDETPGCTKQLCAVRDDYSKFEAKNVKVFGVNPGSGDSHQCFIKHHGFQFPLLIDEGQKVAKLYGCDNWPVVKRTVVAIDRKGMIAYVKQGMPSDDEILKAIPDAAK